MSFLDRILASKHEEVERLREMVGEPRLRDAARRAPPALGFEAALHADPAPRIIAEFKRASPSKGLIRDDLDPGAIARGYAQAGAAALSVLTDGPFFQGSLDDLRAARAVCDLPILRKDFIIDPLQILEARAAGADAILLIVAALDDRGLGELLKAAHETGLEALLEVHTRPELERACAAGGYILGINNRDLHSFRTDVGTTRTLLEHVGEQTIVSESGLRDARVLRELEQAGVHAFLIGEALMRARDPGQALRVLRQRP